jgi:hypothetical protein
MAAFSTARRGHVSEMSHAVLFGRPDGKHWAAGLAYYLVGLSPGGLCSWGFFEAMEPENDEVWAPVCRSFQDFLRNCTELDDAFGVRGKRFIRGD